RRRYQSRQPRCRERLKEQQAVVGGDGAREQARHLRPRRAAFCLMPLAVSLARSSTVAAIVGAYVTLRPPVAADFDAWARIRQGSRSLLKRWEPTWAPDELSKEAFRRRLRRYAQAARDGTGHIFFVFDKKTGALVGGCQLSNIRQGVAQSAATLGYWMGER